MVSAGATAMLVLAQAGTAAATVSEVNTGGRVANAKGTVTGSYSTWTTSSNDPCPPGGSPFTTTVSLTYTDHHGSIAFSAPMEVLGSNSAGPNGTTQTWCYSQYNLSYSNGQPAIGSGRYAPVNTMCGFELGVETDALGGTMFFDANSSNGTFGAYA